MVMISPEIIKKIDDERREKTRSEEHRVPLHRDRTHSDESRKIPEKDEISRKDPSKIIEIQVS